MTEESARPTPGDALRALALNIREVARLTRSDSYGNVRATASTMERWATGLETLADALAEGRCEGRYPVPHNRDEPFEVTYRCALPSGHAGPHGSGAEGRQEPEEKPKLDMWRAINDALFGVEVQTARRIFSERYKGGELALAIEMGLQLVHELREASAEGRAPTETPAPATCSLHGSRLMWVCLECVEANTR